MLNRVCCVFVKLIVLSMRQLRPYTRNPGKVDTDVPVCVTENVVEPIPYWAVRVPPDPPYFE